MTKAKRRWRKAIVLGDVHIPYHDVGVLNLVYDFIKHNSFDLVVLIGDIADCYDISDFSKDPERGVRFPDEARIVKANLRQLRESAGKKAKIVYVAGNHEHRLRRFLMKNARALVGLPGLTIPDIFGLKEFGIEYVDCTAEKFCDTYWRYEDYEIIFGHFARVSKHSAYTAKLLIDDYGVSLIQGHCHSFGTHERLLERGWVQGWENGCLCDLNPSYTKQKNWMHAFHIVWFETPGSFFDVESVRIINGQFRYGGELWRV